MKEKQIEQRLRQLVDERSPKSICPSEVARSLEPRNFRPLMPLVREAAAKLAERGEVIVTQKGRRVDVREARGPVRIRAARSDPAEGS